MAAALFMCAAAAHAQRLDPSEPYDALEFFREQIPQFAYVPISHLRTDSARTVYGYINDESWEQDGMAPVNITIKGTNRNGDDAFTWDEIDVVNFRVRDAADSILYHEIQADWEEDGSVEVTMQGVAYIFGPFRHNKRSVVFPAAHSRRDIFSFLRENIPTPQGF